jgi:RND superfamily putative drug exporter
MTRLTLICLSRPKLTLAVWGVVILVLAGAASKVQDRLKVTGFGVSGTEAARADAIGKTHFGDRVTFLVLLQGPNGEVQRQQAAVAADLRHVRGASVFIPGRAQVLRTRPVRGGLAAPLVAEVASGPEHSLDVAKDVQRRVDATVRAPVSAAIGGEAAVGRGLNDASLDATKKAEAIALPVLLIVLLLVFRSVIAALIPAVFGAATVMAGLGILSIAASAVEIDAFATTLASLLGLALGVDYSLLIVSRFREELAAGRAPRDAAATAAATAGRTVTVAGALLLVGIVIAVLVLPGGLLVSGAAGVAAVTIVSVATAVLVIPCLLALLGPRIDRFSVGRRRAGEPPRFERLAALHRRAALPAVALLVLAGLAAAAATLNVGAPTVGTLPSDNRARQDSETIRAVLGPGWDAPHELLAEAPAGGSVLERTRLTQLEAFQARLGRDAAVAAVLGPGDLARGLRAAPKSLRTGPIARSPRSLAAALRSGPANDRAQAGSVVSLEDGARAARFLVVARDGLDDPGAGALRDRLAADTQSLSRATGMRAAAGGPGGQLVDYSREVSSRIVLLVVLVAVLGYLFLVPVLRSLVLPAIAMALNLLTVAATFGVLTLLFQGDDPLLGGPGSTNALAVAGTFSVLFALSIDYEVFLLTRMREGWERTHENGAAIEHGLRHTAGVITGAAAIMIAVFASFTVTDMSTIRQLGVGLAVAILLDATVVRLLLLPAAMRIAGRFTWWLPPGLERRLPAVATEQTTVAG